MFYDFVTPHSLSFTLNDRYINLFKEILNTWSEYSSNLYLFGSFSKGYIHKNSDIDLILILPDVDMSVKELRNLKAALIEEVLDICIKYDKEIDLKVYGEKNFRLAMSRNYFEQNIVNDLILLKEVVA